MIAFMWSTTLAILALAIILILVKEASDDDFE